MITHIFIQGMFSHFSFEAAPHIEVNHEISVKMCQDIHDARKFLWNERHYAVKIGVNSISTTSSGSLQYDAKSGTVSCLGENARREEDSEQIVQETLVFEHLTLTLSKERGKQLVQGDQTLVILSGPEHGVELTRGEVRRGGVSLGPITYVLDPMEARAQEQCPVAVLREKLTLMRTSESEASHRQQPLQDPDKLDWKNSSLFPTAVIWQNSDIAIHLKKKIRLPPQCKTVADSVFFETNHDSILASPDADPTFIDQIKSNPLDFLTLSNLADESRSDLVHAHVDSLLRNLSAEVQRMDCQDQFEQLWSNTGEETKAGQKRRMVRNGEVMFELLCNKVDLEPGYSNPVAGPTCTQALPVQLPRSQNRMGRKEQQLFLEANTRYLSFSSKKTPCPVQHLAPAAYEAQSGRHVFWNGTAMEYLQQEVLQTQLLKKKYQDLEQFDLNQDLESTGVETEQQLHAGSLFLEYKQFVEVERREDLAGNPPIWDGGQTSSSSQRAHSWYMGARAGIGELSSSALKVAGLGWTTQIVKGLEKMMEWIAPLGHIGGAIYALSLLTGLLTHLIRFMVLAYTMPGTKMTTLLALSRSGEARVRHNLSQEMESLIRRQVAENVQGEMAVARAEKRQGDTRL